jgi:lysophospholipase L1-like esterase
MTYFNILTILLLLTTAAMAQTTHKFDFGFSNTRGSTKVLASDLYSSEKGFGFEPMAEVKCNRDGCTSDKAFYFSAKVPEGNYKVTIGFGSSSFATAPVVKAELRRLMLDGIATAAGRFVTKSFVVNVRTPRIATGGEVKLKDRERNSEQWAWDEKLTLEFNGTQPSIGSIVIEPVYVPTVFLLGDSTVCDQPGEPYASWGQMLTRFFADKIAVANHAESGESLKSSFGAKRLDKVVSLIRPGDFLLIQYGHNDMKETGEGIGAFASYKTSLKQFAEAATAKGAMVILISPMHRRTFDPTGKFITNSHGDYPAAVRQAAIEAKAGFIDLHTRSKDLYEAFGKEGSGALFKEGDGTHHNAFGAYQLAKIIVQTIRDQKVRLANYLAKDWKIFDPKRPDSPTAFSVPASPAVAHQKPLGN